MISTLDQLAGEIPYTITYKAGKTSSLIPGFWCFGYNFYIEARATWEGGKCKKKTKFCSLPSQNDINTFLYHFKIFTEQKIEENLYSGKGRSGEIQGKYIIT